MSAEEVDEQSASRDKPLRKIKEQENNTASGEDVVSNKPTSSGSTEKNKSTMQAASALTCLGNEDGEGRDDDSLPSTVPKKRYIPEHKKPDAALTFPEKLMQMMRLAEKEDSETFCIAWLEDGKSFVIRDPVEFTRTVVPKFFKATKFSSFTRKLYRWGFRQVNRGIGPSDPIIFGNDYFQRDNADLMSKMRSVTAAMCRKQSFEISQIDFENTRKRHLDIQEHEMLELEEQRKRMLLEQMMMPRQNSLSLGGRQNSLSLGGRQNSLSLGGRQNSMSLGGMMDQNSLQQPLTPRSHLNSNLNSNMNPSLFQPGGMQHQQQSLKQMQEQMQSQNQFSSSLDNRNSLLQFPSFQQQQGQQQQAPPLLQQSLQPYNPASTAEIINAAIDALRFAS